MTNVQTLSDDDLLSVDVDYYEHAHDPGQWEVVRRGMVGGEKGQSTLPVWFTVEREVREGGGGGGGNATHSLVLLSSEGVPSPEHDLLLLSSGQHFAQVQTSPGYPHTCLNPPHTHTHTHTPVQWLSCQLLSHTWLHPLPSIPPSSWSC